jgi:hypothetical protein
MWDVRIQVRTRRRPLGWEGFWWFLRRDAYWVNEMGILTVTPHYGKVVRD